MIILITAAITVFYCIVGYFFCIAFEGERGVAAGVFWPVVYLAMAISMPILIVYDSYKQSRRYR